MYFLSLHNEVNRSTDYMTLFYLIAEKAINKNTLNTDFYESCYPREVEIVLPGAL